MVDRGGTTKMEQPPNPSAAGDERWTRIVQKFERVIVLVLIGLLMVVVAISTVELGWLLFRDLLTARAMILDVEEMFELFGFFLMVLIGLELLTTLKVYVRRGVVHLEVVLEVALIAIAQKIIILDTSRAGGLTVIGLSGLVLTLAAAFWLIRTALQRGAAPPSH
jgi:uncharacterized membrane protein (DUF373 family)